MSPEWRLFTRRGCHLCDDFLEALHPLIRGRAEIVEVDIDTDPVLTDRWGTRIPVLCDGDTVVCEGRVDPRSVLMQLASHD